MFTEAQHLPDTSIFPKSDLKLDSEVRRELEDARIEGFIHHPKNFPLHFRKLWFRKAGTDPMPSDTGLGLCFNSHKYISPGTNIEVSIPLRGEEQKFTGKVVLVKNQGEEYEIGIWFEHRDDASRARIVEQICHIETYLKEKRHKEGPYVSREHVAQEWITKFASVFPSI